MIKSFRNLDRTLVLEPSELEVGALVWARTVLATEGALDRGPGGDVQVSLDPRQVILAPVVSEKSYSLIEDNKYSFKVHSRAHKTQIRQAVEELFDVKVVGVNIIKVQPKPKRRGWSKGTRPGWKKAIVQLRAGDRIEIFEGAAV